MESWEGLTVHVRQHVHSDPMSTLVGMKTHRISASRVMQRWKEMDLDLEVSFPVPSLGDAKGFPVPQREALELIQTAF